MQLGDDERRSKAHKIQIGYIKLAALSHAYNLAFNSVFSIFFFNILVTIVTLTYTVLKSAAFPTFVFYAIIVADCSVIAIGYCLFKPATESHMRSKKFLKDAADQSNAACSTFDIYEYFGVLWHPFVCT
jgi:hypothetical protein